METSYPCRGGSSAREGRVGAVRYGFARVPKSVHAGNGTIAPEGEVPLGHCRAIPPIASNYHAVPLELVDEPALEGGFLQS